jgi:hypothetical protein
MNSFRTIVSPEKPPFEISYNDSIVSIGSCFSENIGKKLSERKFNININPFGQQYNPLSVSNAMLRLVSPKPYTEKDLVYHDELYHSFDHHGSFSRSTVDETLQHINSNLATAAAAIKKADILFLTFGTAHYFKLNETNRAVSNCHKLSGTFFTKLLLSPTEIETAVLNAIEKLREINPNIKIILTVSPVRYFAFGHHENTISKSFLFTAIHQLMKNDSNLHYFPAYELVMDDLRDYRFFAEDMLHPNYQATQYVWEALCGSMMYSTTTKKIKEVEEIIAAANHRPRNPRSVAHKKFIQKYLLLMNHFQAQGLNFEIELKKMEAQLQ